ncbi:FAD-dependent monooxygenase [Chitinophaga rhizosphaerae]|uniref:FAD-dependent monooxygenase n=1 Tax=Chitinophaga rhizosphaerae TaxID=1864947 RepID=UPI000F80FE64|nr:FAD-dependent monooxygenase [Chitinophaga rhizosphaerae]
MKKRFTIIGGGIAGLTAAIALRQRGIDPLIFEAAPELKPVGAGIGLGANAIRALALLGIEKGIVAKGQFLDGLSFRTEKDSLLTHADTARVSRAFGQDNFVIHRADLHEQLLSHLDPSRIFTGKMLHSLTIADATNPRRPISSPGVTGNIPGPGESSHAFQSPIHLTFHDGSQHETDYLIAADGIHSAVRRAILPDVQPRYAGYTCWRCVVPEGTAIAREVEEILGRAGRFGIIPLPGKRVYWFACINAPAQDARMKVMTTAELSKIFAGYPERVQALLKASEGLPLIWGDIADLPTTHRFHHGPIVLIGDAAHATTPNMGQGACQAIEDAVILAAELSRNTDPQDAFRAFDNRRQERTRMIIRRSRALGNMAQLQNPVLIGLRNAVFRCTPTAVFRRQLKILYSVDLS